MDDNFKCFYKILKSLEKQLDRAEVDVELFDENALGISKMRWCNYMKILIECEYIAGAEVREYIDDESALINNGIHITLKGLEYLSENTIMQRIYKAMKGIKDLAK